MMQIRKPSRPIPNGFTLMELLIVISIIVILLLLAVPNYLKFRIRGNETSAMTSVKAIYSAQMLYSGQYPTIGYACSLAALGGSTQATNTAAQSGMLSGDLSSGYKDGYNFAITCPQKSSDSAVNAQYKVVATPQNPGKTGVRGFCMDEDGQLMDDPTGGSSCSELAK